MGVYSILISNIGDNVLAFISNIFKGIHLFHPLTQIDAGCFPVDAPVVEDYTVSILVYASIPFFSSKDTEASNGYCLNKLLLWLSGLLDEETKHGLL